MQIVARVLAVTVLSVLLPACGGVPTYEMARSPAMVSFCVAPGDGMQRVLDLAQSHCAASSANAVLLGQQPDGCSRLGNGPAYRGTVMHFRCEK